MESSSLYITPKRKLRSSNSSSSSVEVSPEEKKLKPSISPRDEVMAALKPHLHALKNRHGTAHLWHRAVHFWARHSKFSTCKRRGPK